MKQFVGIKISLKKYFPTYGVRTHFLFDLLPENITLFLFGLIQLITMHVHIDIPAVIDIQFL